MSLEHDDTLDFTLDSTADEPVSRSETLARVTEMRDRYALDVQLLADPDGEGRAVDRHRGDEPRPHR